MIQSYTALNDLIATALRLCGESVDIMEEDSGSEVKDYIDENQNAIVGSAFAVRHWRFAETEFPCEAYDKEDHAAFYGKHPQFQSIWTVDATADEIKAICSVVDVFYKDLHQALKWERLSLVDEEIFGTDYVVEDWDDPPENFIRARFTSKVDIKLWPPAFCQYVLNKFCIDLSRIAGKEIAQSEKYLMLDAVRLEAAAREDDENTNRRMRAVNHDDLRYSDWSWLRC